MQHKIKATIKPFDGQSPHSDCPQGWKVTLRYGRRQLTSTLWSSGLDDKPDAWDATSQIQDAAKHAVDDFNAWCALVGIEHGTDDYADAAKDHAECVAKLPKVKRLFGDDFDEFVARGFGGAGLDALTGCYDR